MAKFKVGDRVINREGLYGSVFRVIAKENDMFRRGYYDVKLDGYWYKTFEMDECEEYKEYYLVCTKYK